MKCISPYYIPKKHQQVPCGRCNFCLQSRRADWTFRLLREAKHSLSEYFLTLTYEESNMPLGEQELPTLHKRDLQMFIKRLRKASANKLRYYAVGEYGTETQRPHYHVIMFNLEKRIVQQLHKIWQNGICHVGDVSQASIHYVTGYVINRYRDYPGRAPPFATMSRRPGLGANYLQTHYKYHKDEKRTQVRIGDAVSRLPRYYKDRIFDDWERAYLRLDGMSYMHSAEVSELRELTRFHSDPYAYRQERLRDAHELITLKSKKL